MRRRAARLTVVVAALLAGGTAAAAPFIPTDDDQVLQSGLPNTDPRMREMRAFAAELSKRPDDQKTAMRLASRQLAMGVAEADPRFVGYAQATLAHWWQDPAPGAGFRVLRARVRQAQHDFAAAAVDLRAALQDEPGNLEALLLLASVDEVSGELAEAKQACIRFTRLHPGLAAVACVASVESLTGAPGSSTADLVEAIDAAPPRGAEAQMVWALTILSEIAIRRGDAMAETYLQRALALDNRNVYVLTTFADYLLDQGRAGKVLALLAGFERIDALYLRLALAAQAAGDQRFDRYSEDVRARLVAARRQGDVLHLRDAARFALEIDRDAPQSLAFAQQNWATHKTPADARAVLAAALACRDTTAATPIAAWIATTRLEDRTLTRLVEELATLAAPPAEAVGRPQRE